MPETVLILGANGRFGRAAVEAFSDANWHVRALTRTGAGDDKQGVDRVAVDAFDADALSAAARGSDVIVNALNTPYPTWRRDTPRLTAAVLAAAGDSGATVMIPGNIYSYGAGMPEVLTEATPHEPTTRKGRLRLAMEDAYAAAARNGIKTIVLRAGDFIEREKTGNWFDTYITAKLDRGRVMYPGPLDRVHAWAYLPDMARAMAALARRRSELSNFEAIGFEGFSLTGRDLIDGIERAIGRELRVDAMPWGIVRALGVVSPMMREVAEMAYLWRAPHRIDGQRLRTLLPELKSTPLDHALQDALAVPTPEAGLAFHVP